MAFQNRSEAGRRLARRLKHLRGCNVVVLAVSHGGAPVAFEVARALSAPLDVIVAQRIADPFMSGLTVGAVAEDGVAVADPSALQRAGLRAADLAEIVQGLKVDIAGRARRLRAGRAPVPLAQRTAVLIDDVVVTGATARAAGRAVRARKPDRIVLAAPVVCANALVGLHDEAEEIVRIDTPEWISSVCRWYHDFPVTTDEEVATILRRAAIRSPYRAGRREHPPVPHGLGSAAA